LAFPTKMIPIPIWDGSPNTLAGLWQQTESKVLKNSFYICETDTIDSSL
jgi:hypothetical protein